jgi:hypothetical protein
MNPIETTGSNFEADWDSFAITRCDFRPQWNGDLVNLFSVVNKREDESTTEDFMKDCARSIAGWVGEHKEQFGPEDRFQIVIGWPTNVRTTGRHTIKTGGTYHDLKSLADGLAEIQMRRGWSDGVFTKNNQANTVRLGAASPPPAP